MTDGQLYLDTALFERNQRPAIDVGRSVSRVGGAAQLAALRAAAHNLRIVMSRLEALEALTRVGLDTDPATRKAVERGHLLRELLRQPRFTRRSVAAQVVALTAVAEGRLDAMPAAAARSILWSAVERATRELHRQ
jgi:F-type H+-transporting ATPase subunit alpha